MNKQTIIESIKAEKPYLHEHFGVKEVALFGFYVIGEEKVEIDFPQLKEVIKYRVK